MQTLISLNLNMLSKLYNYICMQYRQNVYPLVRLNNSKSIFYTKNIKKNDKMYTMPFTYVFGNQVSQEICIKGNFVYIHRTTPPFGHPSTSVEGNLLPRAYSLLSCHYLISKLSHFQIFKFWNCFISTSPHCLISSFPNGLLTSHFSLLTFPVWLYGRIRIISHLKNL